MATLSAEDRWTIPMLSGKCVAYLRRSDLPYGRLDANAQRAQIASQIRPGYARIIKEFEELEPLVSHWRPALEEAVRYCHEQQAILVIGQIDRMRSAVQWLGFVRDWGVKFRGADAPHINHLTYHQLSSADLYWRRDLGRSVRESLTKAKVAGKKLGGDRGFKDGLTLGPSASAAARRGRADQRDSWLMREIRQIQHRGVNTLSGIATRLNQMGYSAPRGGKWSAAQVSRVIRRFSDGP